MERFERKGAFLGRGWSFPPTFDSRAGEIVMVEDVQDIRQSLHILFSTSLGERLMLPEYGCTLQNHVFDPIGVPLFTQLEDLISNAVLFFEPRIVLNAVKAVQNSANRAQVDIVLDFTVRQTNTRSNMVYPFYQSEGTNVRAIGAP